MKIGFYGDSFCSEITNPHSILKGYETYIKKIKKHYNAEITHLGHPGSSIWDVILTQFKLESLPDICIFCWTDYNRLYNKNVRNITPINVNFKDYSIFDNMLHSKTIDAAKQYYKYLHDPEKAKIETLAIFQYFDTNILSQIDSKIIHVWSSPFPYKWNHGVTVDKPLIDFYKYESFAPNHLDGEEINQQVFELIKNKIL